MPFSTYLRDPEPASGSAAGNHPSRQQQNGAQRGQSNQHSLYSASRTSTTYPLSEFTQQQGSAYGLFSSHPYDFAINPANMSNIMTAPMAMGNYYSDYQADEQPSTSSSTMDVQTTPNSEQKPTSEINGRPPAFQMPSFLLDPFGTPIGGSSMTPGGSTDGVYGFAQQPPYGSTFFGQGGDMGKWPCVPSSLHSI